MKTDTLEIIKILKRIMRKKKRLPSQMAKDIDVNHATVLRWLIGKDKPSFRSCSKISKYSGISVETLLFAAGYLDKTEKDRIAFWPEFREYAKKKYPNELDEDIINMIEALIERRRNNDQQQSNSKG